MLKLVIILNFIFCLQVYATASAQAVSLTVKEEKLELVMQMIRKQTGYSFLFNAKILEAAKPVTASFGGVPLSEALKEVFKGQPLDYEINGKSVTVTMKALPGSSGSKPAQQAVTGKVTDSLGNPLGGVNIAIKDGRHLATSNADGTFSLGALSVNSQVVFTLMGYAPLEIVYYGQTRLSAKLLPVISRLDEIVVIGYGLTTQRRNTGSVGRITSAEIGNQPVSNPVAALSGRIAGVVVTQSNGVPGSSFNVEIRGRNSIAQGTSPFYVIDGVPFSAETSIINQQLNAATVSTYGRPTGLSPFSVINPNDIESIEVLKDADATAIYGSRGANGVVLITTKKGKSEQTAATAKIYGGASTVSRRLKLLSTAQYVGMRKEAFENDGVTMTTANAQDILVWDTTRYTDWQDMLIGGTAKSYNANVAVSGGNRYTRFLLSGNHNYEGTVYPGQYGYRRTTTHFNVNHNSPNDRFLLNFTGAYSADKNNLPISDLATTVLALAPNTPELINDKGDLLWEYNGYTLTNPLADLYRSSVAQNQNFLGNINASFKILRDLTAKVNFGYNAMWLDEQTKSPAYTTSPAYRNGGSASFYNSKFSSMILEPQIYYHRNFDRHSLGILLGGAYQRNTSSVSGIDGYGYTSDALLGTIAAATSSTHTMSSSVYKYAAAFGRLSYSFDDTYLLNITARRDGSSRFGPGRQFATFGALGAGWIFSNLEPLKNVRDIISFGKIRASYGTSGNDAIGNYQYLDSYSASLYPYGGIAGIYPSRLFNADYGWEVNKKLEAGLELGFLKNRILFNTSWYSNRSGNQLIQYALSSQTGFSSITRNLPATVRNNGWEFLVTTVNIQKDHFNWNSSLNITVPSNKLLSFPGLTTSSYRNEYKIGAPLNIASGFPLIGVDPQTGVYSFTSAGGAATSAPLYPDDFVLDIARLDPKFYGGLSNTITYKGFQADVFFEFRKQTGFSYKRAIPAPPGSNRNQPEIVMDRWQQPGDITDIQRFTTTTGNAAFQANLRINNNGAINQYADASFIRLKNVSLSYSLPASILRKSAIKSCRFFVQGQNLLLITGYYGTDPETQLFSRLPPLRSYVLGLEVSI